MTPYKVIPLSLETDLPSYTRLVKRRARYKNGSYEKSDLMEQFRLDASGKVAGFKQWVAMDSVNFGRRYGGKYFGKKKENTVRPFMFSNRTNKSNRGACCRLQSYGY